MADADKKTKAAAAQTQIPDRHLIEQEEAELEKKNKWLYPTVITVLIVFFVVGFIYGLQTVLSMEGAYPTPVLAESKTEPPTSNAVLISYLREVVDQAKREKPAFSRSADFSIDKDGISADLEGKGKDTLLKTLTYITDDADDFLDGSVFPPKEGDSDPNKRDFSAGFGDLLNDPAFSAEDIDSFSCNYIYFRCISCGNRSDEPLEACEACGSDYPYQKMYEDNYSFTVELKLNEDLIDKNFFPMTEEEIKTMLAPSLEGYATVSDVKKDYKAIRVHFVVNRITNDLLSLIYEKDLDLTCGVAFAGDFSSLGTTSISMPITEKLHYDFVWPGVTLSAHEMSLEPKGKDNLTATLSCDDPTAYDAKWTSSDPNIVQVDDEGYLTACKQDGGTAIITATFDFNGKTYSDSCEITVKYPVESMKLNKKHLSLGVNDTATLTATVSPKNATFKTATWYTTDESIVSVDPKTGLITAVAPGVATVYALSDDGAYKSSCEVTVR